MQLENEKIFFMVSYYKKTQYVVQVSHYCKQTPRSLG